MSVLLPAEAKDDLLSGAFVCRHKAGSWNAVSADHVGEQTAIKIGKGGGLNYTTLSSTQVAEWIESFTISAYVSDTLDHWYSPDLTSSSTETPHKEEGVNRCNVDEDNRQRISTELGKCFYSLDTERGVLYNIHNGQVAPTVVNVSGSFGWMMATAFRNSLPTEMNIWNEVSELVTKVMFDLESIFLRLLVVGQQREMEPLPIYSEDTESRQLSRVVRRAGWGECHSRGPHGRWTAVLAALYVSTGTWKTQARHNLYIRKQGKPPRIMLLPPRDTNLYLHVRRAHLQMLLWKATDQQGPPDVSISEYDWKIDDGITCPSIVERRTRHARKAIVTGTKSSSWWGGFKLEIGFEWSTAGISTGIYFILNIYINELDDDITSKVTQKWLGKLKVMQIDSIYKMILISW